MTQYSHFLPTAFIGFNLLTVQPGSMETELFCEHSYRKYGLEKPLSNPCYIHVGFLFVNSQVLTRNQVFGFLSLQMIQGLRPCKVMQMEMLHTTLLIPPSRPFGDDKNES
jgi:hypothetical protein